MENGFRAEWTWLSLDNRNYCQHNCNLVNGTDFQSTLCLTQHEPCLFAKIRRHSHIKVIWGRVFYNLLSIHAFGYKLSFFKLVRNVYRFWGLIHRRLPTGVRACEAQNVFGVSNSDEKSIENFYALNIWSVLLLPQRSHYNFGVFEFLYVLIKDILSFLRLNEARPAKTAKAKRCT